MKKLLILLLVSCCMHIAFAQDYAKLTQYLQAHAIRFDPSTDNDSFILAKMKGKTLLMYGEGGSHELKANRIIETELMRILQSTGKFRNFFIERGRGYACVYNTYLQTGYDFGFISPDSIAYHMQLKLLKDDNVNQAPQIIGIDFERWRAFFLSTNQLLKKYKPFQNRFLISITDSSIVNKFRNNSSPCLAERHFTKYYKKLAKEFAKDSLAIKAEINNDSIYRNVKYLVSNSNITHRYGNRNPPMVRNLLAESQTSDTNYVDFLRIGGMHIQHFISTQHLNAKDSKLKDKVLTMMMYCKNCIIIDTSLRSASYRGYFKNEATFQCFDQVASQMGQYVLFDLTALPPEFHYLKKLNGDLLLFVTNVD